METGLEAVRPKGPSELRKVGPGKSWIGKSQAIELIQDHHFFILAIQAMAIGKAALWPKWLLELRKVGPGKSWIGRSKATEQIQDHHFLPPCNPGHGFGPRTPKSPMSKTAIRVEKSGSWEVLDW